MDLPSGTSGRAAIDVARLCADEARRIITDAYGRVVVTEVKGRGNIATETDLMVERQVTAILRQEFPTHALLAEETLAATRSEEWMWVVDPIDGTKNFSRGIPHFAFAIALCRKSEPVLALTLHPVTGHEFAAIAGEGFRVNGVPRRVSHIETLAGSVAAFDLGYNDERGRSQLQAALHLWPGMQALRVTGSAVLGPAYVAAGHWDIYVHLDLRPWDIAGGILLVREAGGVVTDRGGAPATIYSESVVAATPAVHADFMRLVEGIEWRA